MSESRLQSLQARMAEIKGQIKSLQNEYEKVSKEMERVELVVTVDKWIEALDFEIPDEDALRSTILSGLKELPTVDTVKDWTKAVDYTWEENNESFEINLRFYEDDESYRLYLVVPSPDESKYPIIVKYRNDVDQNIEISSWEDLQKIDKRFMVAAIIHHLRWEY